MVESKLLPSLRMNQKGQGMIEYILLLVITVSMILLALANIFKPLQGFMQNYMGTYVACLLSSGELPSIRTENTLKDSDPKCSYSVTFGQAGGGGSGPGGGGNPTTNPGGNNNPNDPNNPNNNGNNGANGKNGKDSKNSSSNGSDVNGNGNGGGSGGNSYAGSRSRRSGFGKSAFLRRNSDGSNGESDGMAGDGNKKYVNNLDRNKDDRFFRSQQRRTQLGGRNGRGIAISGLTEEEQQKIERKIQSEARVVPKSSEEFSVPAKKTILKPPSEKEKKKLEEKEQGFTLGNFFKYVLIAVVLLLILVLGGGQAFEMSKTMD